MATNVKGMFQEELREAILHSKVLVVGAGGIGCEILKNLVMSGFPDIEIVSVKSVLSQYLYCNLAYCKFAREPTSCNLVFMCILLCRVVFCNL